MHFAFPPRKDAKFPPYVAARAPPRRQYLRRVRLRQFLVGLGLFLFLIFIISRIRGGGGSSSGGGKQQAPAEPWKDLYELEDGSLVERNLPAGTPTVVIVTPIDPQYGAAYEEMIVTNRKRYAALHGYDVFAPNLFDYDTYIPGLSRTWSRIPCMRDALNRFPHTPWFFFLDQHALVMNTSVPISTISAASQLRDHLRPNLPIVPSQGTIKTLDLRDEAQRVDFIITQDTAGLAVSSFLLRRGEWAKYFLDAWFDPLYRSYNFEMAERHALEHLVQWHKTILSQVAIVPQRLMAAYWSSATSADTSSYRDGDFVVVSHGCDKDTPNSCNARITALYARWMHIDEQAADATAAEMR